MGHKNLFPNTYNWQSTDPAPTLLPLKANQTGSIPSGSVGGAMASTNVIYSNILEISRMDNIGLQVDWTGTPTGTFEVMASNDGVTFHAITFNPSLAQPAGSAGGYLVNINQFSWRYIMLRYTNTSGTGTLTVFGMNRDLN